MKILSFIFFFLTMQIFAQSTIDSIVNSKTHELQLSDIKDFFYFETYCTGRVKLQKLGEIDCSVEDSNIYLFWRKSTQSFLQKISLCKTEKVEIPNDILDFYFANLNNIKNEYVKSYQTGKNSFTSVSHSCFSKFHFYISAIAIQKRFDEFDITGENTNLNYVANNNLKLVKLAKLCKKIIEEKHIN